MVAGDFFDNLSGMFAGGGGHLSIPDIFTNQFSAKDKSTGSNVTEQSPAEAELTLTVDTWKEVSYVIEDRQLKQIMAGSDVLDAYASQAKYLIAKALIQKGFKVTIVVSDYGQPSKEILHEIIVQKAPFRYLGGSNRHFIVDTIKLLLVLRKVRADFYLLKTPISLLFALGIYRWFGEKLMRFSLI